jgi:aldehyde decarbonylase
MPSERDGFLRYLIFPLAWLLSWGRAWQRIVEHALAATALRYFVHMVATFCVKCDALSADRKILLRNPPSSQHERERDWDLSLVLAPAMLGLLGALSPHFRDERIVPFNWASVGVCLATHMLVVEPIYYVYHRFVLHHPSLFRYSHAHHHSSVVAEVVTGNSHPIPELLSYLALFSLPLFVLACAGILSFELLYGYAAVFDLANLVGHTNVECVPRFWQSHPILKSLFYTTSFHSLHHTAFSCNYSLFCPLWDYVGGTLHPRTDGLYEEVVERASEEPELVFLVHYNGPESLLHAPHLSTYLAVSERVLRWWMIPIWPLLWIAMWLLFWLLPQFNCPAVCLQRFKYRGTRCSLWCVPAPIAAYVPTFPISKWTLPHLRRVILSAAIQAHKAGARVVGLGALNKAQWLNGGGCELRDALVNMEKVTSLSVVHGNGLTAAAVWQTLLLRSKPTDRVLVVGATSKIGTALCLRLAARGNPVLVRTDSEARGLELLRRLSMIETKDVERPNSKHSLILDWCDSRTSSCHIWVLCEQLDAAVLRSCAPHDALLLNVAVPDPSRSFRAANPDFHFVDAAALSFERSHCDLTFCFDIPGTMPACLAGALLHVRAGWKTHETGEVDAERLEDLWSRATADGFRLAFTEASSLNEDCAEMERPCHSSKGD